jgi:lipopolysaccharide export system protein LptA
MRDTRSALRLASGILLLAVSVPAQQDVNMEISGFRVPEYDDQGIMTSQLFGDRAEVGGGGEVKITGLRIEFYKGGKTLMEVSSPYCFYNQKTREAHSDAPVAADMERVKVRGRGFRLQSDKGEVRVLEESRVTIEDVMQQVESSTPLSGDRGTNDVTVISSKEMALDYKAKTVRFEQNVHVQDPKMALDCGTLAVRFGEKNEIDWIEALTGVKILHEGREANAGKAVYDVKSDEFVLEDNPRLTDGRNTLFGERIRFWRADRRMVCEPLARLVIYPDEKLDTGIFEK